MKLKLALVLALMALSGLSACGIDGAPLTPPAKSHSAAASS